MQEDQTEHCSLYGRHADNKGRKSTPVPGMVDTRESVITIAIRMIWPVFAVLGFAVKCLDKVAVSWWLGPILQRKANRALLRDLQSALGTLHMEGRMEEEHSVLPFDYASVYLFFGNLRFCFTRGRGELNVSVSPVHDPEDSYELALVISALDSIEPKEVDLRNLEAVGESVRTHLHAINNAFNSYNYPEFRRKLLVLRQNVRILTRQTEWELRKRLRS